MTLSDVRYIKQGDFVRNIKHSYLGKMRERTTQFFVILANR